jgi:imidazolonepropionase-like amidohydrolase
MATRNVETAAALFIASLAATVMAQTAPNGGPSRALLRYDFVRGGNVIGHLTVNGDDSARTARFDGDDGGRSWGFDESARLDRDGIPTSITMAGTDASGQPVRDQYQAEGHTGTWRNDAESGSAPAARRFYLTMPVLEGQIAAMPDELGRLARALLASPTHSLALAPAGSATVRRLGSLPVSGRAGAKQVEQYEILGLDYAPFQIWLEADGTLFAAFTAGTIVREGWTDVVPALQAAQTVALRHHVTALKAEMDRPRAGPFAFVHARVFDPRTGSAQGRMTVVVDGRTIQAVGADGTVRLAPGEERIDASGATLLPGLWDMHTHLTPIDGVLHLSAGVTTVRDLGNDVDQVLAMRRDFAEGRAIGPRVLLAGLIDGRGPYQGPTTLLVDDADEARTVVDRLATTGFEQVKVYGSIKAALVPDISRMAHERGLRVGGHVPAFMTARQAVEAGFDEINHINYMFLNFMPDVKHLEGPERVTATAGGAAAIDLGSEPVQEFVGFLRQHGTIIDPTLSTWETRLLAPAGRIDPAVIPVFDRLPLKPRRAALRAGLPATPGQAPRYRDAFAAMLRMDRLLYERGVTLVTGSDGLARFGFDRELELQVQAGVPAARVLRMATLDAAQAMHREKALGTIEAGKLADLVLVAGAPDLHISDVRRARYVVKDGALFRVDRLDRALSLRTGGGS